MLPDPERWLPKHERSAYKKKLNRKFKDRDIGRGTQGVSTAQTSNFYMLESIYNFIMPLIEILEKEKLFFY